MTGDSTPSRRDRILAAASREFAQHGFAGARMDRIAGSAGVNKQLLFHYFGSKRGLHRAAVGSVLERHAVVPQPGKRPVEALRDLIAQLAATADAHPSLLALLSTSVAKRDSTPDVVELADEWRSSARLNASEILQAGQRAGYFRDDLDLESISELIVGASLGSAASGDRETAGHSGRYRETLVEMAVDYCAWR